MNKLVAAAVAALVLCAPVLAASVVQGGSEQSGYVYSPVTLPGAKLGTKYDVTMTARYPAINGGGYASLTTQMTLTTSSEAAPGILFRSGSVPGGGGSSLELVGTPTAPGAFHFATCVVLSDGSCVLKQWTLVVAGETKPEIPRSEAKQLEEAVDGAIAEERTASAEIGNDANKDDAARARLYLGYKTLADVLSKLGEYALPSAHNPESAIGSAKSADAGAYDVMGGNKTGLKGDQAKSDFAYSKELQTKALNFIAQGIAAKKTASADLSFLAGS